MSGGRVIVVGGGVIGTACAYYLSRAGWAGGRCERAPQWRAGSLHGHQR